METPSDTKVLLVDDEKEFVDALAMRLKLRKFNVSVAYNGLDAINSVEQLKPDIVVLDMKMPLMNGIEVLRRLKISMPTLPVIILSGYSNEADIKEAQAVGISDILGKPPEIAQLINSILKALGR
ncbi:MAG: response regulator [Nitrospirae bacterium YQR-1]